LTYPFRKARLLADESGARAGLQENHTMPARLMIAGAAAAVMAGACAPTVQLAGTPDKPIVINLNVKIDQEVRVKLDKEVNDLIAKNKDVF